MNVSNGIWRSTIPGFETSCRTFLIRMVWIKEMSTSLAPIIRELKQVWTPELWNSKKVQDPTGHRLTLNQTYTLNDFHFDHDPVYHNNRLAAIPIYVYEAELLYQAPCGFYAGPNLQCNFSRYPVDQANTLYAGAYALLGFRTGYAGTWGKSKYSVFVEAKNLTDKNYAASVDPIGNGDPSAQVFHPGDNRSFYGGISLSW